MAYTATGSASLHPAMLLAPAGLRLRDRRLPAGAGAGDLDSVAFRYMAANKHPDHDTIAAFRKRFLKEIEALFVKILLLATRWAC